ncbi:MAG: hypothetical protein CL933_21290 [Deltaproteobacteria bacterium]|nr:hypothetical protein [Deltaproteobacteria bacterium]
MLFLIAGRLTVRFVLFAVRLSDRPPSAPQGCGHYTASRRDRTRPPQSHPGDRRAPKSHLLRHEPFPVRTRDETGVPPGGPSD